MSTPSPVVAELGGPLSQILLCVLPDQREQQCVVPQTTRRQFFRGLAAPKSKLDMLLLWPPR
jgi:hypothetical protein